MAVTVFFLYALFPAAAVKRYVESLSRRLDPSLETVVGQVRPAFPAHVRLADIRLRYHRRLLFEVPQARVSPRFLAALSGKRGYTVRCSAYGGTMTAKLEIVSGLPAGRIRIEALNLAKIPVLRRLDDLKPAGRLDLAVDLLPKDGIAAGTGTFHIGDFKIRLARLVPAGAPLSFDSIDAKIRLDGNQLAIADGRARGRQTDAAIRGSLGVQAPLAASQLDLSLTVRPHAEFIAALRKNPALQWLSAGMAGSRGLALRITGTLEDPQVSLQ